MAMSEMFPTNFRLHMPIDYLLFPLFDLLYKGLIWSQAFQKYFAILQIVPNNSSDYLKHNSLQYI